MVAILEFHFRIPAARVVELWVHAVI